MSNQSTNTEFKPESVSYRRCTVDLTSNKVVLSSEVCQTMVDVLGGFGRSFQVLGKRDVKDAYADNNPLIVTTGIMTGSNIMTGLRTYFSAYSPLKGSNAGLPSAMWSAGSGKFGSKLKWAGIDEIVFEGKSERPVVLYIKQGEEDEQPIVTLIPADELLGLHSHEKIMTMHEQYKGAHFAMIGPSGENYENCYMGGVALSTENQLKSGDDKSRWAGRGGMGSVMGSKNLIGIIAQSTDVKIKPSVEIRDINKKILTGPGSRKFREAKKGGLGGTWANYVSLEQYHFVPENNFRPKGEGKPELLFREAVENEFAVKAENCFKCAIACHKNIYEKNEDGTRGKFLAKFDYEPLNLLSTNLGVHDPKQATDLVAMCDKMGMDSISLGVTISYVLDYNERHPEKPLCNGATFGDFEKIIELIEQTGRGQAADVGRGSMRLSKKVGEPDYAMHVKGLELPAYLGDTNPGYAWAIAGGHMTMATYMLYAMEKDASVDYWAEAITGRGLYFVRDDLLGVCKFAMLDIEGALNALKSGADIDITEQQLMGAVRQSFIYALWLEQKQGYTKEEYTLPGEIFDKPNPALKIEPFITREFFAELSEKVWAKFDQEIAEL